jgi:hypothetical protein
MPTPNGRFARKWRRALFPSYGPIEPFLGRRALIGVDFDRGTLMSQNVYLRITAEGRLFGLNSGDWTMLVGGFALVALVILLL